MFGGSSCQSMAFSNPLDRVRMHAYPPHPGPWVPTAASLQGNLAQPSRSNPAAAKSTGHKQSLGFAHPQSLCSYRVIGSFKRTHLVQPQLASNHVILIPRKWDAMGVGWGAGIPTNESTMLRDGNSRLPRALCPYGKLLDQQSEYSLVLNAVSTGPPPLPHAHHSWESSRKHSGLTSWC